MRSFLTALSFSGVCGFASVEKPVRLEISAEGFTGGLKLDPNFCTNADTKLNIGAEWCSILDEQDCGDGGADAFRVGASGKFDACAWDTAVGGCRMAQVAYECDPSCLAEGGNTASSPSPPGGITTETTEVCNTHAVLDASEPDGYRLEEVCTTSTSAVTGRRLADVSDTNPDCESTEISRTLNAEGNIVIVTNACSKRMTFVEGVLQLICTCETRTSIQLSEDGDAAPGTPGVCTDVVPHYW